MRGRRNEEDWSGIRERHRRGERPDYSSEPLEVTSELRRDDRTVDGMREYRVRPSGVARTLNQPAIDALSTLLTQTFHHFEFDPEHAGSHRHHVHRAFKDQIYQYLRQYRAKNLSQMASDKVWPLFWAAFTGRDDCGMVNHYSRENAKQWLDAFKSRHGMSNADWKYFCSKDPYYLYHHFSQRGPHDIRWPDSLITCETRNNDAMQLPDFKAWMKEFFIAGNHYKSENDRTQNRFSWPGKREFDSTMTDLIDGLRGTGQAGEAVVRRVFAARNWIEFQSRVQEIERNHARGRYGVSPAMQGRIDLGAYSSEIHRSMTMRPSMMRGVQASHQIEGQRQREQRALYERHARGEMTATEVHQRMAHMEEHFTRNREAMMRDYQDALFRAVPNMWMGADFTAGSMESFSTAKPEKAEPYEWLHKDLPRSGAYAGGKFTFTLIDDTMKLYNEGTGMKHCIWRLYQGKFKNGKYLAYHIDAPHLNKYGFTCGFHQAATYQLDTRAGAVNVMDKGKRLSAAWKLDQVKGISNLTSSDKELDAVAKMLLEWVNQYQPIPAEEKKNDDKKKTTANSIINAALAHLGVVNN